MYCYRMGRKAVSERDHAHGRRLGQLIADSRRTQNRSAPELAVESAVSIDAVRSLENGRVPLPSFLTIARLARALGLSLDQLHLHASQPGDLERTQK